MTDEESNEDSNDDETLSYLIASGLLPDTEFEAQRSRGAAPSRQKIVE